MGVDLRKYTAVIQAGGKGTRMQSLTKDLIPKPMLLLNGKPMLQWQIEDLARLGVEDFIIVIGHLGDKVKEYFKDGKDLKVKISYIEEKEPLGSAGALFYAKQYISNDNFILVYGDVMLSVDWNRMALFHESNNSMATLLAHPNGHPYDSDLLLIDSKGVVSGIDSKQNIRDYWYNNCVNAGVYILSTQILNGFISAQKKDLEKDILLPLMKTGLVYGYMTPEYVKDAGTPERFENVSIEQKNGIWEKKNLINKQRCIFLDRDGTVNKHKGLIFSDEDLELEEGVVQAIKQINASGYLAILITNQPVVARGLCDIKDVEYIHKKLQTLLGNEGAYIDDISFCPHHPDKGYPEENPKYKIVCECRKPATGMIDKMAQKYNIDLSKSWMIGDTTMDIQTGINAGVKTALVLTGEAGNDGKYKVESDIIGSDLLNVVNQILNME